MATACAVGSFGLIVKIFPLYKIISGSVLPKYNKGIPAAKTPRNCLLEGS